jgi:formylglycine-generating enzyme required for sulfatase activity
MDTYEASVWRVPSPTTVNRSLVAKIQQGRATAADLAAGGAAQLGIGRTDDYAPCTDGGQNCADDIYAVSLPGVPPSANITWFQAEAACENARKRLPSSAEWQAAVAGSPDPGPTTGPSGCNTDNDHLVATGSSSSCKSSDGAFDMVGNVLERVADWVPQSFRCGSWDSDVSPTGDAQCLIDAVTTGEPGGLMRGGVGTFDGPLAVDGNFQLSDSEPFVGFRCAR